MNGERAEREFQRITDFVKQSKSDCKIERSLGELDSVHLTFKCGVQRYSVAWVGAQLEQWNNDELWRQLEIVTQGKIKKPELSFERDIRPLFRDDLDILTMKKYGLDLSSYSDVKAHAQSIHQTLVTGSMPCDGAWPADRIGLFKTWMDEGMAP